MEGKAGKKGVIWKTWERCKSLGKQQRKLGCVSIYVGAGAGAEKVRFMIKMKYVNHPLFKALLEEAEAEYGYSSEGPLLLPCEVDYFVDMLAEINRTQKGKGAPPRLLAFA